MSWIATLLIGIAVADLAHSVRPARIVNECVGAAVAVWVGLLAGLTSLVDVVALLVIAILVVLWGQSVTRGFGRGPAWLPLLVLGLSVLVGLLASGAATEADGLIGRWLRETDVPLLAAMDAERLVVLVAVLLIQLSTGNVIVRLVLAVTETVNPAYHDTPADPEQQLKGGRLLGPMERVFILGLGLAGQLTAAAIVVAAKGLLRWPELQSKPDQHRIHQLTEYFLVGSFVSWLVALSSLLLAST